MITIIGEKPSVAREIARLLGVHNKNNGYLEGNGYYVTWALGHLIGNAMPEDYGLSGFKSDELPILPEKFLLTVRKIKNRNGYVEDKNALNQLKVIEQLFLKSNSIIVATDAGREGELIFRYIYEYLQCRKAFQRLWISSLTEKAIKDGFASLKDGREFDMLYQAALSRSRADWLVGINATQALSVAAGRGLYSLGRVQTPTLALICKRYYDHKNFEAKNYWQIELSHQYGPTMFKSLSSTKWDNEDAANDVLRAIKRKNSALVASVTTKNVSEQPPLLFDLTALQKEANQKLNLSADETSKIAQALYEKQFITYPRTGSKYIPEDMWPEIPNLLRALKDRPSCRKAVEDVKWGRLNKRIVNDLRVTDHHGLLPTEKIPSTLNGVESALYDMISLRLLEAVSGNCSKEITTILLEVYHYHFFAKGSRIIEAGWRNIKGNFTDDNDEFLQDLPDIKEGTAVKIENAAIITEKTKAPALYTEAGLLTAMEHAGREIETKEEREALRDIGIGTPATRASIIETLFERQYIQRQNKSLVPTSKGLEVYQTVRGLKIADVALTADWEVSMRKIELGESSAEQFQKSIEDFTKSITQELLLTNVPKAESIELNCPLCSQRLLIREKLIKCPDEQCNWVQFRNVCGVQLTMTDLESLVKNKKTSLVKGFKSKSGKSFDAFIVMNEAGKTSFEFAKTTKKTK